VAAILLHPTDPKQYFERKWTTEELKERKEPLYQSVKGIWESEYKDLTAGPPPPTEDDTNKEVDPFEAYLADTDAPQISDDDDPFDTFISGPRTVIDNDHLLTWWNDNSNPWRQMRSMALDLFSIPAMSSEIERVFSSARLLLTTQRQRLSEITIEEAELLRH
jgi:hAT family C-terminal dimerisation region